MCVRGKAQSSLDVAGAQAFWPPKACHVGSVMVFTDLQGISCKH